MKKKLHWFLFVFEFGKTHVSAYRGHRRNEITTDHIADAKERADVPEGALLLNVSYLGRMTMERFDPEHTKEVSCMNKSDIFVPVIATCAALAIYISLVMAIVQNGTDIKTLQTQTTDWREMSKAIADCNGYIRIRQETIEGVVHHFYDNSECE